MAEPNFTRIERGLRAIIDQLVDELSPAEQREVLDFVEAGEYGLALETLSALLVDERKRVPEAVYGQMVELADTMRIRARIMTEALSNQRRPVAARVSGPRPRPELMRRAATLAERAVREESGGPFGAVVTRGREVVGEGWNRVLETHDPTAHAEVNAIRAASARLARPDLSGCELYASCEPCPMCLAAAHWARLDRIWFAGTRGDARAAGFDDAVFHAEFEKPPERRALPVLPFLREAALPAFEAWAAKPDRRLY